MDFSRERLLSEIARDAAGAVDREAERRGWALDLLTERQFRHLHKHALLESAADASARQLQFELTEAGRERFHEVFRARRPESRMLSEQLERSEP